jgi:signal transduction histidine kinase
LAAPPLNAGTVSPIDTLRSFDRINLGSTFFQATIVLAFAAAHVGATEQFKRPALRPLTKFWILFALAAVVNIFSSWAGAIWQSRELSRAFTTLVAALTAAAVSYVQATAARLARDDAPPASAASAWRLGVEVFLLHGIGVFGLGALFPDQRVYAVTFSRGLSLAITIVMAHAVWREERGAQDNRDALRLLRFGFAALAVRALIAFGLGLRVGLGNLSFTLETLALSAEVLTMMAVGALSLLATTAAELRFEQQQAEALGEARMRLAAGERLESLGRLAAGIAHDIGNVLQVVRLSVDEFAMQRSVPKDDPLLREVIKSSDHGRSLIRQLLMFARQRPMAPTRFDAAERLLGVEGVLKRLVPNGTEFSVEVASMDAHLLMEPTMFEQVAINLVTNARDAVESGGRVTVRLDLVAFDQAPSARPEVPPGRYVRLSVSDTGTGIPPEVVARIFEPFYTTKGEGKGTGLGLATVYGIARSSGGDVVVHSVEGEGTRFEVYFPAA